VSEELKRGRATFINFKKTKFKKTIIQGISDSNIQIDDLLEIIDDLADEHT